MSKSTVVLIMLLCMGKATKAETAISSITVSYAPKAYHSFIKGSFINNDIDMLAVQYNNWIGFTFLNSYGEQSYGIAKAFDYIDTHRFSLGLKLGVVLGYRDRYRVNAEGTRIVWRGEHVVRPVIAPSITYKHNSVFSYTLTQQANASVLAVNIKL